MKAHLTLLLMAGIVGVIANPVSKQESLSNKEPLLSETGESQVKHKDVTVNKSEPAPIEIVANEEFLPTPDVGGETTNFGDGEVDIVIEENVTPLEDISDAQNDIKIDDDDYLSPSNSLMDNILVDRIKDEIMQTAAGFAPIPLFRKRQKQPPRRRFAIRRQFQRYPYAPYRRLPFYYPYYRFYRPSSLRFY